MSITISGLIVGILGIFLKWAGVEYDVQALQGWVTTTISILGAIAVYIGRYRQGDIKWWGGRK